MLTQPLLDHIDAPERPTRWQRILWFSPLMLVPYLAGVLTALAVVGLAAVLGWV